MGGDRRVGSLVQVDAGRVGAGQDDVVAGDAAPVLHAAAPVAAEAAAGAAAEGEADALLPGMAPLAAPEVLLEEVLLAAALAHGPVARAVPALFRDPQIVL